jgi:hypothetical protein
MKEQTTSPDITNFADTHDGQQAKAVYLAAIESEEFTDPVQPLQIFTNLRGALIEVHNKPAKVIPVFERYTLDLMDVQKLFLAKRVKMYFEKTVFDFDGQEDKPGKQEEDISLEHDTDFHGQDGEYLTGIVEPMRAYISRMERAVLPKVSDMRATLKEVFTKEIERLPEYLETLEPKDRLNFICKMVPYVLPKVEAVASTIDEKDDFFKFL